MFPSIKYMYTHRIILLALTTLIIPSPLSTEKRLSFFCQTFERSISPGYSDSLLIDIISVEFYDKISLHNIPADSIEFCEIKYVENFTISEGKS